jgi:hypothetical protein
MSNQCSSGAPLRGLIRPVMPELDSLRGIASPAQPSKSEARVPESSMSCEIAAEAKD